MPNWLGDPIAGSCLLFSIFMLILVLKKARRSKTSFSNEFAKLILEPGPLTYLPWSILIAIGLMWPISVAYYTYGAQARPVVTCITLAAVLLAYLNLVRVYLRLKRRGKDS